MRALLQGTVASGCALAAFAAVAAARAHDRATRRVLDDLAGPHSIRAGSLFAPPAFVTRAMGEVALPLTPGRTWAMWICGAAACGVSGTVLGGVPLGAIGIAAWTFAPLVAWRLLRHRRDEARDAAVPHVLDAISRGLRSGASLQQSLVESIPSAGVLSGELAVVATEAERGGGVVPALEHWDDRAGLASIRLAVAALCLGAEAGGAQAQAVDSVGSTVRQRLALSSEVRALASQARLSAVVIAVAPLAFCAVASAADPRVAALLLGTPLGWVLLAVGISLDALGALWMGHLTHL